MQRRTKIFLCVLLGLFCALALAVLISWVALSHDNFNRTIKPGDKYTVGDRQYTLPKLPIRSTTMPKSASSPDNSVQILRDEFLQKQRDLLVRVTSTLDKLGVEYWLSGGTLLGFIRHGTFIPWDDDMDLHTSWDNRPMLYGLGPRGEEFNRALASVGLESIMLPGIGTYESSTKEGAAVRLRVVGTDLPVCDIFFERPSFKDTNVWTKIDSWTVGISGGPPDVVESTKERWTHEQLFPLQKVHVDGLELAMPAKPDEILAIQYSPKAMQEMVYRHPMLSHQFPFRFLFGVWTRRQN